MQVRKEDNNSDKNGVLSFLRSIHFVKKSSDNVDNSIEEMRRSHRIKTKTFAIGITFIWQYYVSNFFILISQQCYI